MRGLNIPPTSYLLPPARCAVRSDAPRRSVRSDAPPERRVVPCQGAKFSTLPFRRLPSRSAVSVQARHCSRLIGKFNFQLSIFNLGAQALLLPLTLQSYNTGEAKSSIWRKQRRAARVFLLACRRSALIVNRLAANGLSSFALAPLVLRLRLALFCYSVTVLQFQNGYYAGGERNKTNFYIYNISTKKFSQYKNTSNQFTKHKNGHFKETLKQPFYRLQIKIESKKDYLTSSP